MTQKQHHHHQQQLANTPLFDDYDDNEVNEIEDYDDFQLSQGQRGGGIRISKTRMSSRAKSSGSGGSIYSSKHTRIRENRTSGTIEKK
jgi:hypothetical protein